MNVNFKTARRTNSGHNISEMNNIYLLIGERLQFNKYNPKLIIVFSLYQTEFKRI